MASVRRNPAWMVTRRDGLRVALKVTPRAARSSVQGLEIDAAGRERLAVRVTAPPEDGKANAAVIRLLAKRWRVPPGDLELVSGSTARHKVVHVHGEPSAIRARVQATERQGGSR